MSLSGVNSGIDDAPRPEPDLNSGHRERWSIPGPSRLPLAGTLIYVGIRLLSVVLTALLLGSGNYQRRHWSLIRWMRSSDGGHYRAIAEHGYAYPAGQLAHASVFSWFPGYPAAIDALAWLPWISIVTAGLIVTAIAGMAAAWGLTRLGLKLTGDPRISLLLVAAGRRRPARAARAHRVPGVRSGGHAPAGRVVLGRAACHAHDVRLGDEHAARGEGHAARLALGGADPGGRHGHRRRAAHVLEPDRADPRVPARLHGRGGRAGGDH